MVAKVNRARTNAKRAKVFATNTAFKSYPVTQFQFPDIGDTPGRLIDNAYDLLYRRTNINEDSDSSPIASWDFFGPARVASILLGNGLTYSWMNDAGTNSAVQAPTPGNPAGVPNPVWGDITTDRLGYDGSGRMIGKRFLLGGLGAATLVAFTTAFDRANNKFYERALHAENRSNLYEPFDSNGIPTGGYDSLDRLRQYQRGNLSSTGGDGGNGGGSIALSGSTREYINLTNAFATRTYDLDGLGNWKKTLFLPSGSTTSQTEVRQHNGLNQITRTANATTATTVNPTYDKNGNMLTDGANSYAWDALNRMVAPTIGGTALGPYVYDAFHRRIRKTVGSVTTDFIYQGWRCMEDRNPFGGDGGETDTVLIQYVWGRYLDELIQMVTHVPITTGAGDATTTYEPDLYYPLQDLLYRTMATTDSHANIAEAYDFDAYGNTLIFNLYGSGSNWWAPDARTSPNALCQFLFTGQRFDAETGLVYYKRRYYLAWLGRFLSHDTIVYAGGVNPYRYCGNRPTKAVDPTGEVDFSDVPDYEHQFNVTGGGAAVNSQPIKPLIPLPIGLNTGGATNITTINGQRYAPQTTYGSTYELLFDFLQGTGDSGYANAQFSGPCTRESNDMRNSLGMRFVRNKFYDSNAVHYQGAVGTTLAAFETIPFDPLFLYTQSQVGAYDVDVFNNGDGTATFVVYNPVDSSSLFYHLVPNKTSPGPCTLKYQVIFWTEKIDNSRLPHAPLNFQDAPMKPQKPIPVDATPSA